MTEENALTANLDASLDRLNAFELACTKQLAVADYEGALETLRKAAAVDHRLRRALGNLGNVTHRAKELRACRDRALTVLRLIDALRIDGLTSIDPAEWPVGFADERLSRVINFEDPDWPKVIDIRLVEVTFIATRAKLPAWSLRHFTTLRRCYALGMYDVTYVFLRGMIEAVSFEWLAQHRHVRTDDRVRSLAEWRLSECLTLVRDRAQLPPNLFTRVSKVVRQANLIIHSKRDVLVPDQATTIRAVRDVVDYSERLFA